MTDTFHRSSSSSSMGTFTNTYDSERSNSCVVIIDVTLSPFKRIRPTALPSSFAPPGTAALGLGAGSDINDGHIFKNLDSEPSVLGEDRYNRVNKNK